MRKNYEIPICDEDEKTDRSQGLKLEFVSELFLRKFWYGPYLEFLDEFWAL